MIISSKTILPRILAIAICIILLPYSLKAQIHPSLANRELKNRQITIQKFGHKGSYNSIIKALSYLHAVQNPDGSWGSMGQDAMTSFAILCFLTHAEVIENNKYGEAVKLGLNFLSQSKINSNSLHAYPHAIKTYALAEAVALYKDKELFEIMEKHVDLILEGQQKEGMFDYNYKTNMSRQDLSVSSWNFQALKAAFVAGSQNEKLKPAIRKTIKWLQGSCSGENKFPYSTSNNEYKTGKSKHTMRAAGALSLQIFNQGKFPELKDDLKDIALQDMGNLNWIKPPKACLYGWYYATQVMFNVGGKYWKAWNGKLSPILILNQNPDGSWKYPGLYHGHNIGDETTQKVYATSLCTLMLSTPFRYVPSAPLVPGKQLNEAVIDNVNKKIEKP